MSGERARVQRGRASQANPAEAPALPGWRVQGAAGIVIAVTASVVLGGIVPVALVMSLPDTDRSNAWIVTLGVMIFSAIRLAHLAAKGETRLLEFVTWVYVYVFLGLAATVQLRTGAISTTTQGMPPEYDGLTSLAVVLGIAAFVVGIAVARATGRRRQAAPRDAQINIRAAVALIVVGFGPVLYYVASVGVGALFTDRATIRAVRAAVWPDLATESMVVAMAVYPMVVATHALAYARRNHPGKDKPRVTRLAWLSALIVMIVINPFTSARYVFGSVWGGLLNVIGAFRTVARTRITMLGIVVGLLFLFPMADAFRRADASAERAGFFEEYQYNGDYDSFWQITNAIIYVQERGVTWGGQILGSLFFWVPRAIWSNKPIGTGVLLAENRGYAFTNLSAPLWAEAMVNFGWLGLAAVFLAVGFAIGRLDISAAAALRRGTWSAVPVAITSFYLLILLRGSLLQATGTLAVMMICALVVRGKRYEPTATTDQQQNAPPPEPRAETSRSLR